ncbi:MAG: DUF2934 domain-containing protein [Nitrospiraceae bacterium]
MKQRRSTKGKPSSGQGVPDSNPVKTPADPPQAAGLKKSKPAQAASPGNLSTDAPGQYPTEQAESSRSMQSASEIVPERWEAEGGESCRTTAAESDMRRSGHTRERIAERAYALYEAAGYEHGRELEHWLEAEREVAGENREWDH